MKTATAELIARDIRHLVHPLQARKTQENAHVWASGKGAVLVDVDGREFLDGLSGLWNVVAGHGRTELADAARQQMERLGYCSSYSGSTTSQAIQLGERLSGLTYPSINRFFFTSGGGEASETNFKVARSYWKIRGFPDKTKVISRQWGYHGVTLAAMSATGIANYWPQFEPRVPGFLQIPSPYPYRYEATSGTSPGVAAADELEKAIVREGAETVAMFLAEPVQGAGGVIVPQDDYFPRIREICDRHDVLLVADEVITGFGRTGKWFALEHWGVEPDMIQFAKAITSGYFPFGGIGLTNEIAETIEGGDSPWMHAFTYSAHPVGCAVALRNLDILEQESLPFQAGQKGAYLLSALRTALADHPHVGDIRGKGLMCALEYVRDKSTKEEFDPADRVGERVNAAAQGRGLFSRLRGDVWLLAPPFITSHDQLDRIVDILAASTREVLG